MTRFERSFWFIADVVVPVGVGIGLIGWMGYVVVRGFVKEKFRC